jgi:hypothetical protein
MMIRTMRIAPTCQMSFERITRRKEGSSQIGCPPTQRSQLFRLLSQCSMAKSTNTLDMVLRNTVISGLIPGVDQVVGEALVIFGTLPQLKPPSSHSRRVSEQQGLLPNRCVRTTLSDQVGEWGQRRLNQFKHHDRCPVRDLEVTKRHKVLLLLVA